MKKIRIELYNLTKNNTIITGKLVIESQSEYILADVIVEENKSTRKFESYSVPKSMAVKVDVQPGFNFKFVEMSGKVRVFGLKKSKYKLFICDEFGNVVTCYKLREDEFYKIVHEDYCVNEKSLISDDVFFKAYISDGLYCVSSNLKY